MVDASGLVKAELRELDEKLEKPTDKKVVVQFNPESLKVAFANQIANQQQGAGDQQQASSRQFVGAGTTKLTLQLYFDVNAEFAQGQTPEKDVRKLTQGVAYFITPKKVRVENTDKYLPPGVRFLWGSFQFDGFMDSMDETLEFFSPEGIPQRATVSIALSQQRITEFTFNPTTGKPGSSRAPGQASPVGSTPLTEAPAGSNLQSLAGSADWRQIAQANNIENPRLLQAGQLIDFSATVRIS
jgi:hypothetical protein